jgi:hypothetical protein
MGDAGNGCVDWGYLYRLAVLKALFSGDDDITSDAATWSRVICDLSASTSAPVPPMTLREATESMPAPATPVAPHFRSMDPCAGGCVGNGARCGYRYCWG